MTFLMGAGVAVMQPALPSLVRSWFPSAAALATAVYANGLLIGETIGASLTLPFVLPLVGGSWELSFAAWSVPVFVSAALIALATPHAAHESGGRPALWWPDWRNRPMWEIGLMQGGCGVMYFGANAFMADYLHAIGEGEMVGTCLTFLNSGQLPASFVILAFAARLAGRKAPLIAVGLIGFLGLAGLFTGMPALMAAGSAAIGFAAAFVLILTLALPPLIAEPDDVHRFSAGMFAIGYTVVFFVPLIGGAAWDLTGIAATAFLPVALGAALVLVMTILLPPVGGAAHQRR